jgi:hypothetical protein
MNLRRLRARSTRDWVCLLLLPALAFRLLVPAGFMPTAGDGFSVTMQMCHGDAKSSVVVRLTGTGEAPAGQQASHDAPCVFAASATVAPPSLAVVPLASATAPQSDPVPQQRIPALRPLHQPQSPRAPPTHV